MHIRELMFDRQLGFRQREGPLALGLELAAQNFEQCGITHAEAGNDGACVLQAAGIVQHIRGTERASTNATGCFCAAGRPRAKLAKLYM